MDLSKGRKSKNILDRRTSNKDAYISESGNRYADEKDFVDSVIPQKLPINTNPTKLGTSVDLYIKNLDNPKPKPKTKPKPKKKI